MALSVKCPKCEQLMPNLLGEGTDVNFGGDHSFRTLVYKCPLCQTFLGCQVDPIAMKSKTVASVVAEMKKLLAKPE